MEQISGISSPASSAILFSQKLSPVDKSRSDCFTSPALLFFSPLLSHREICFLPLTNPGGLDQFYDDDETSRNGETPEFPDVLSEAYLDTKISRDSLTRGDVAPFLVHVQNWESYYCFISLLQF